MRGLVAGCGCRTEWARRRNDAALAERVKIGVRFGVVAVCAMKDGKTQGVPHFQTVKLGDREGRGIRQTVSVCPR